MKSDRFKNSAASRSGRRYRSAAARNLRLFPRKPSLDSKPLWDESGPSRRRLDPRTALDRSQPQAALESLYERGA
jgi:hypothetical protein